MTISSSVETAYYQLVPTVVPSCRGRVFPRRRPRGVGHRPSAGSEANGRKRAGKTGTFAAAAQDAAQGSRASAKPLHRSTHVQVAFYLRPGGGGGRWAVGGGCREGGGVWAGVTTLRHRCWCARRSVHLSLGNPRAPHGHPHARQNPPPLTHLPLICLGINTH